MMKNKKGMTKQAAERKETKARALERESNLTLISTSAAIVSFFIMLYVHNAVTTNFVRAQGILSVLEVVMIAAALVLVIVALIKKKKFLWEYVVLCLVLCIGYYFLEHGSSGLPFLTSYNEETGAYVVSSLAPFVSKIINTKTVIYALWAFNVVYCVGTIVYHSVRYTKIKKGDN